jgi:transcriptional regulator with GAF, ATPase, and Fis domain
VSQIKLKRLLSKKQGTTSLLDVLRTNPDLIGVTDADGSLLFGVKDDTSGKHPIVTEGQVLGWVIGGDTAHLAAHLLTHLIGKEAENAALTDDTLELYREINLLYSLSERLLASLDVYVVASTALEEAGRLIQSTDGFVILTNSNPSAFEVIARFVQSHFEPLALSLADAIWSKLAAGEKAEIINDVRSDERFVGLELSFDAIAYAPLKGRQRTIGMVILIRRLSVAFTARDIKLLNTLASQTSPALENALLHKKVLEEAQAREERLHKQIREMRIELDEARQEKQVAEITESDYFQQLSSQADDLRKLMSD